MHIAYTTPHGILLILAFIFGVCALIPWRATQPGTPPITAIPWWGLSWLFFVGAFIFAP
jgi:hypothetical protein